MSIAGYLLLAWTIIGPFWCALLHRIDAWPQREWDYWLGLASTGPLTWFLLGLLKLHQLRQIREDR